MGRVGARERAVEREPRRELPWGTKKAASVALSVGGEDVGKDEKEGADREEEEVGADEVCKRGGKEGGSEGTEEGEMAGI